MNIVTVIIAPEVSNNKCRIPSAEYFFTNKPSDPLSQDTLLYNFSFR